MNWKFWKRKEKNETPYKFPCASDECLVRAVCTQACEKIEMDDEKVMKLWIKYKRCPDCGCDSLMEGPTGGGAINVKCNGCGHWFNFCLPLFIQRIHIDSNGRFHE